MKVANNIKYTIDKINVVYVIRFYQYWNIQDAQLFFEDYKVIIKQDNMPKFSVLSDMRLLAGATEDAINFFEEISNWAEENGQIARALLLGSLFNKFIIKHIDINKRTFPVKVFENDESALKWLGSLGYPFDNVSNKMEY